MKVFAHLWFFASLAWVGVVVLHGFAWLVRSDLPLSSPLRWFLRLPLPAPKLGLDWPDCWPFVLGIANALCAVLVIIWLDRRARRRKGGHSEA